MLTDAFCAHPCFGHHPRWTDEDEQELGIPLNDGERRSGGTRQRRARQGEGGLELPPLQSAAAAAGDV